MVEVKEELRDDKPFATITSEKRKSPLFVQKSNDGFIFFEVKTDKGPLPKALQGRYTSIKAGIEAVVSFINSAPESVAARRDNGYKSRHPDKA